MTPSRRPFSWLSRLNPFAAPAAPSEIPADGSEGAPTSSAAPEVSPEPAAMAVASGEGIGPGFAPEASEVVFLPRDPQWAYCFWTVSETDRQRAEAAGANGLCLRLADVTGLSDLQGHPHALQELVVDAAASEWFLPVPLPGRDYRVELGYRLRGGGWYSLAFSAVARVPDAEPSASIADAFIPFTLDAPLSGTPELIPSGGVEHERLYQRSTVTAQRSRRVGSEVLHELDVADRDGGLSDSGAGLWASGRSESGSGLVRSRSFWLVADAELIIYGATEPTATLSIGDRVVPLNEDGGFRMHVPFPDGQQSYPIQAVAADGEQKRSITMNFERRTPHARVNRREEAVEEWF